MPKVTINENVCKGCGLCVSVCPKSILKLDENRLNAKGHSPAAVTEQEKCIACAFCAKICPDCAITVEK